MVIWQRRRILILNMPLLAILSVSADHRLAPYIAVHWATTPIGISTLTGSAQAQTPIGPTGANWDSGTAPISTSIVTFDGTSHGVSNANPNKDSTIDTDFTIASLTITSGYTGTITQSGNLTITGDYSQTGNSVFNSNPSYTFSVGGSFTIPVPGTGAFTRYTGDGTSSGDPYYIYDIYGLQGMMDNLSAYYALANNIDASVTLGWNSGAGFIPIGNDSTNTGSSGTTPFSGTFDGQGYVINNLTINDASDVAVGLFGESSGTISNVGITGGAVSGPSSSLGSLVGEMTAGTITNPMQQGM